MWRRNDWVIFISEDFLTNILAINLQHKCTKLMFAIRSDSGLGRMYYVPYTIDVFFIHFERGLLCWCFFLMLYSLGLYIYMPCHAMLYAVFIITVGNGNEVCQGHIIWQCGFFMWNNIVRNKNIETSKRMNETIKCFVIFRTSPSAYTMRKRYCFFSLSLSPVSLPNLCSILESIVQHMLLPIFQFSQLENKHIKCIHCMVSV